MEMRRWRLWSRADVSQREGRCSEFKGLHRDFFMVLLDIGSVSDIYFFKFIGKIKIDSDKTRVVPDSDTTKNSSIGIGESLNPGSNPIPCSYTRPIVMPASFA